MSRKKGLMVGDRVLLRYEMVQGVRGRPIPCGTVGTVIGLGKGIPQIDFGQYGIKNVAPHAIDVMDSPDGAPEPEDGDDLVGIVAHLLAENTTRRRQLAGFRPQIGRS